MQVTEFIQQVDSEIANLRSDIKNLQSEQVDVTALWGAVEGLKVARQIATGEYEAEQ